MLLLNLAAVRWQIDLTAALNVVTFFAKLSHVFLDIPIFDNDLPRASQVKERLRFKQVGHSRPQKGP